MLLQRTAVGTPLIPTGAQAVVAFAHDDVDELFVAAAAARHIQLKPLASRVIAESLGITARTDANLLGRVSAKCGFSNGRADLARLFTTWGLPAHAASIG